VQGPLYNPRDVAVLALRDRNGNVTAHLERLLAKGNRSRQDAALARELALGTARRRGAIQAIQRGFLARPDRRLPGAVQEILDVGLYQVLYLDRVPQFAAVDEAVAQARRFRHKRQSGLVNGVLRTVTRSMSEARDGPPPMSADVLPIGVDRYRTFDRAVFADPSTDAAGYLADAYSLPKLLARRWVERFGSPAEPVRIAAASNAKPPLIFRVNRRMAEVESIVAELSAAGLGARPHANGLSVVLDGYCHVTELECFQRGAVQPQDPTATAVAVAAEPEPGMNVLDFCAAPGVKTTHLAELMDNQGSITAIDVSMTKTQRIEDNCRRMDAGIVKTMLAHEAGRLEPESFDIVLADVPCTNTGVLARRVEARWRFGQHELESVVGDQKTLARLAAGFVRPGGRLVYSTCSIEPEECSGVAGWLADREGRLRLVREQLTLPGGADDPTQWHDGGYVAILEAE
jgi:16S rRNA (cytosine967-C5)-methyltransferase